MKHKKDCSPYVPQNDKIKNYLEIRQIPWTEKQKEFLSLLSNKETKIIFCEGPSGVGKAQPLDTEIITPFGIKKMKDIKIGELVSTPDGNDATVIGIFPQGEKDVYEITFSDGSKTECCGEHLWMTQTLNQRRNRIKINKKRYSSPKDFSIKNTIEIKNSILKISPSKKELNHNIPICKPINFKNKYKLDISPYILGVLIGDGCIRYNVCLTSADKEIIEKIKLELPENMEIHQKSEIEYSIVDNNASWIKPNRFKTILKELKLFGKYSFEKFIPDIYKYTSINDRIELLKGLMDTDGTTDGYRTSFSTSSYLLANDVKWLVESLGGICYLNKYKSFYTYMGIKKQGKDSYNLCICMNPEINPFFLKRKREKFIPKTKYVPKRFITKVEIIGKKECQCILIDSNEHLYLTNNFIVTHNTLLAVYSGLLLLNEKKCSEILFIRTPVESSSFGLGYLKGDLEEKFNPYLGSLEDKLNELLKKQDIDYLKSNNKILTIPVGFLRGASINTTCIIAEESQNYDIKDFLLIMSRMGKFSKLIFIGDSQQSDIKRSGFKLVSNLFNNSKSKEKGIHCFKFEKQDIMRNEILSFIIEKFESIDN